MTDIDIVTRLAREACSAAKEAPRMYFAPLVWLWRAIRAKEPT